jgi:hypothetical protein
MAYLIAVMSCVILGTVVFWCYARYASWDMKRLDAKLANLGYKDKDCG